MNHGKHISLFLLFQDYIVPKKNMTLVKKMDT